MRPLTDPILAALRAALEAGENQRALAARVGMTQARLNRLLTGKSTITLETADRVAEVFSLQLVGRDGAG